MVKLKNARVRIRKRTLCEVPDTLADDHPFLRKNQERIKNWRCQDAAHLWVFMPLLAAPICFYQPAQLNFETKCREGTLVLVSHESLCVQHVQEPLVFLREVSPSCVLTPPSLHVHNSALRKPPARDVAAEDPMR